MNLHIIHKSAHHHASATDALPMINKDDFVMFIDEGIYNSIENTAIAKAFIEKSPHCYYLQEHADARGIKKTSTQIKAASMTDFVQFSLQATHNISWY